MCVIFEFRQFVFFYSGNSSTYFKVLCRSLQKKKSDRTRCLAVSILEYNLGPEINGSEVGIRSRQNERKCFGFLKYSDSSVVRDE